MANIIHTEKAPIIENYEPPLDIHRGISSKTVGNTKLTMSHVFIPPPVATNGTIMSNATPIFRFIRTASAVLSDLIMRWKPWTPKRAILCSRQFELLRSRTGRMDHQQSDCGQRQR